MKPSIRKAVRFIKLFLVGVMGIDEKPLRASTLRELDGQQVNVGYI